MRSKQRRFDIMKLCRSQSEMVRLWSCFNVNVPETKTNIKAHSELLAWPILLSMFWPNEKPFHMSLSTFPCQSKYSWRMLVICLLKLKYKGLVDLGPTTGFASVLLKTRILETKCYFHHSNSENVQIFQKRNRISSIGKTAIWPVCRLDDWDWNRYFH